MRVKYKKISKNYNISSYPALENCLFRAASLTKNVDIDQYEYSGYGNGFDRTGQFSFDYGEKRYPNFRSRTFTSVTWYYIKSKKNCIPLVLLKIIKKLFELAIEF